MSSKSSKPSIAPDLQRYVPLLGFLAAILGEDSEVVLYDVRSTHGSIVAIVNGDLSGRKAGDSAKKQVKEILASEELRTKDYLVHREVRSRKGVVYKSHTFLIRDKAGENYGMLCINTDVRKLIQARELFATLSRMQDPGTSRSARLDFQNRTGMEGAHSDIGLKFASLGQDPALMSGDDRLHFVARLDSDGVFMLRGAIARVASALNVSKATVYRILRETRHRRRAPDDGAPNHTGGANT
jgi:predicted transcriptional regulator YheO